ncbi:hypothetical protein PV11_00315 [Exophiala sideris]|uniref:Heterokaryon incompatibility domain-containing protein n=1 Tax=Exophiala sideris TaxID=1016849 RepID=A0A0D1X9P1_9EURO|nr:hypothetical protein PV11_00315 [Exophiala sideris]
MTARFGASYERHPMVAPIWERLGAIEQKLSRLDDAVSAVLERLEISVPNDTVQASTVLEDDEPYTYGALDNANNEIRLLALELAGDEEDKLSGKLVHVSLEKQLPTDLNQYNALSYVWGDPKMQKSISIEGHPLMITESLNSALRHMRKLVIKNRQQSTDTSRWSYWWIDQICINQADIEERSHQVSLMRRVYKKATTVQVWLGDAIEGSTTAMEVINRIGKPPLRGPGEKEVRYPTFSEEEISEHWGAVRLLLERPWWERCWVRQEAALGARTLVSWGESCCSLDVISQAVMAVEYAQSLRYNIPGSGDTSDELTISFYQHAANIRALRKRSHRGSSFVPLPELIISARYCKATDTRDKVFSMLGLADPEVYQIHTDYRLSLAEVCKTSACEILPRKHGLRLLGACQTAERKDELPSWVPNFSDWKYFPFETIDGRHNVNLQDSEVAFDGDALLVKGFLFDTITDLCETTVTPNASLEQIDHIHETWQNFFEQSLEDLSVAYGPIPSRVHEEKARMWMDFLTTDNSASRFIKFGDDGNLLPEREEQLKLQYMGLNLKLARSYLLPADFEGGQHSQRRVRAALQKYGPGRQLGFCANRTKAMVLLPEDARPGDVVAILRGATFPYILRKCSDEEEYVLVGEAYMPAYATNKAISLGLRIEAKMLRII